MCKRIYLLMRIFIISFILFLYSYSVFAGTTGKIAGTVREVTSGEPLPGANIFLVGTTMGAASDMNGRYVMLNIPPGTYTIRADYIGYQSTQFENIRVSIDLTTTIDFELSESVIELGEAVVLIAERPIVQRDLTSSAAHVAAEQIKNLPVQEFKEVLNLQAGITIDDGGGTHIRGGRKSEIVYWIDGRPVTDVYDGEFSLEIENESIQELQVISGTYNAEYGNAMSGVVNIVTKEGGDRYNGQLTIWGGDFMSRNNTLSDIDGALPALKFINGDTLNTGIPVFDNIDDVGLHNYNIQGSLSGPVPLLGDKVKFFATGRYYKTDGWLYGRQFFTPDGIVKLFSGDLPADPDLVLGNGAAVPMNDRKKLSGQIKLSYAITPTFKINLTAIGSKTDFHDYNHDYKWNPDGNLDKFDRGYDLSFLLTHSVSAKAFYTLNISRYFSGFKEYVFEDPNDSRYVNQSNPILARANNQFWIGGTNLHRFERDTKTWQVKWDITSQISQIHQLKLGVEARRHELSLEEINLISETNPLTGVSTGGLFVPDFENVNHDVYNQKPVDFSAYVQDKIEYQNVIINVGLRLDYIDSKGRVLADSLDPNIFEPFKPQNDNLTFEQREEIWYNDVDAKVRLSPRFGIGYPITDRGVIHFSYGHFLQVPSFRFLYNKPGFKVNKVDPFQGVFGNADLKPQKTVMYELGLQQQIFEDIRFDITTFYRDVRDWVTTGVPIETSIAGVSYVTYINRDYANVRGITLSLNKRPAGIFSFNLDYTFQVAEGTNSNPEAEFTSIRDNDEPTRQITPLDWDQRHTLNVFLNFGKSDWGFNLLGRYGSGLPYTPDIQTAARQGVNLSNTLLQNSRRRPNSYTFDIKAYKRLDMGAFRYTIFANIFNVLDQRNGVKVFGDTGKPDVSLSSDLPHDQGFFVRPDHFSKPREIQVGVEIGF